MESLSSGRTVGCARLNRLLLEQWGFRIKNTRQPARRRVQAGLDVPSAPKGPPLSFSDLHWSIPITMDL